MKKAFGIATLCSGIAFLTSAVILLYLYFEDINRMVNRVKAISNRNKYIGSIKKK